jgi:hypothetical protein
VNQFKSSTSAAAIVAALLLPSAAEAACSVPSSGLIVVDDMCFYDIAPGAVHSVLADGRSLFDIVNRGELNDNTPGALGALDIRNGFDFSFVNEGAVKAYKSGISIIDSWYFGLENQGTINSETDVGISLGNSSDFDLINSGTIDGAYGAIKAVAVKNFYLLNTETGVIKGGLGSSLDVIGTGEVIVENHGRMESFVSFQSAAHMLNTGYVYSLGTSGGSLELYQRGYIENTFLTVGGNTLYIEPGAHFGSSVEFNNTVDNTIHFAPGSYTLAVKGFAEDDNDVTLYNRYQSLIVTGDPADEAVLDVVQSNGASALPGAIGLQIGAISDIVGGIAPQGGPAGGSTALGYASVPAPTGTAAAGTNLANPAQNDASRFFWLNGVGGGGRDRVSLTDTAHAGLVAGYEIRDGAMRAGFLGGIGQLSNDGQAGTGSVDADTAFAGAYYGGQKGAYDIDALLIAGGLKADTTRGVSGGGNAAAGSYDGWYIAPELAVSRTLALPDGWSLTPSARLRYVGTWLDGYTETGSVQNVRYDDRSSHVVEGSLEVRLGKTHTFGNGMDMRLDLSAALVESLNLGDSTFDATLVNAAFTTSAFSDRSVTGGRFGASAELKLDERTSIHGGGKLGVYSDDSWAWSANGGVKVAF